MNDEFGIRKSGRRRRTTRRLLRHSARQAHQANEGLLDTPVTAASFAQTQPNPVFTDDAGSDSEQTRTSATDGDASASQTRAKLVATLETPLVAAEPATSSEPPISDTNTDTDVTDTDVTDTNTDTNDPATGEDDVALLELEPDAAPPGVDTELEQAATFEDEPATGTHAASAVREAKTGADARPLGGLEGGAAEVKTRPEIRLPDTGTPRRPSPRPPVPAAASTPNGRGLLSPVPLTAAGERVPSIVPPVPNALPRSDRPVPTGEGIIRQSVSPPSNQEDDRPDLISDVPTRPRIHLTPDMARAAGRVTSLDVPRYADDGLATVPRISLPGAEPAVIVTRARVISDPPPGSNLDEPEAPRSRQSRRHRPDSEEFEMLDLEDEDADADVPETLELTAPLAEARGAEAGPRVSRTPPPPPAAQPNRRAPASVQRGAAPPPPPPGVAAKKPERADKADKPDKAAAEVAQKAQSKRRGWWEVLFSDDYVRTLPRPSQAQIAKQVAFMETSFGISRGDAVLDVGCGLGMHALEFARRGYLVVALDLALSMITRAAEAAQQQSLRINFLHKDIRDIGFEGTFDAIVCVGTTFGFFDDEQNRGVLMRLANALKPGGRLLLEVVNRDYVVTSQPNLVWFEGEGCVVMEESDFNFYTSRLNVKRTMMREDGRQTESEYSVRLYSVHELGQMLKQAGFGIKEVSGQEATPGVFFGCNSSRIIMLAERRSPNQRSRGDSTPPE